MADNSRCHDHDLADFPSEPHAVPGCNACLGICVARTNARSRGDYSAVTDSNVRLRRHQAEKHL
ncbi:hypothetical protein ABTZ78_06215 [Streptomyces bauhiniae]|uniref:hypothetical protein n=1 Tax=Streptomyces bauhiniae TaxID=2340725 RepID=UPI00332BDDA2